MMSFSSVRNVCVVDVCVGVCVCVCVCVCVFARALAQRTEGKTEEVRKTGNERRGQLEEDSTAQHLP
jgi:hypothetical protein